MENEKVSGEISSDAVPKQAIREISLVNKSLILSYTFTWEGNPLDAVVSLTPVDDGKMTAQIDFAGGAYVMSGTADAAATSRSRCRPEVASKSGNNLGTIAPKFGCRRFARAFRPGSMLARTGRKKLLAGGPSKLSRTELP